ncbi:hypothetical protein BC834DRAFT_474588 [Gloeopeniophorella convolvens]|nr:hypothetical protein BC834DRAFT_474588 [Gloeopeniophorella convolvens]
MHVNKLPNELLVEIFDSYRLTFDVDDNLTDKLTQNKWFPLAQVCRRWRHVMLGSSTRLRLGLYVRKPKRAKHILPLFPTLPLILKLNDQAAISDVLPLLKRTYAVALTASRAEPVHRVLPHVTSLLRYLEIMVRGDNSPPVAVPGRLLSGTNAPHLRTLFLGYVLDVRSLKTITSSTITSLHLKEIPGLFPEDVWGLLRGVPRLEHLEVDVDEMPGNGEVGDAGPVHMPCLKTLSFTGFVQWLSNFVGGITATTVVDLTVVIVDDIEELEEDQDLTDISELMGHPVEGPTDFTSVAELDLKAAEFFCGMTIGDDYERKARFLFPTAESPEDKLYAMSMATAMLEDMVAASVQTLEFTDRLPESTVDEDLDLQQWREGQSTLWHNLMEFFPQVDKIVTPYADAPAILGMLRHSDKEAQREAEPALLVPLLREVTIVNQGDASGEELGPLVASFIGRRWSLTRQKVEVGFEGMDDEDMDE